MKNLASAIFFTLSDHAARQSGNAIREAVTTLGGIVIGAVSASWISVKTIFNVMSLRVRKGDMIEIILDGGAEEEDSQRLTEFAQLNL
ncbi:MAG: HPr family phosphocarrier protein [Lachnospiraceae bacterium]|nr:HPr family phosphocarrier protein [Lachnospiraceae bacterium]